MGGKNMTQVMDNCEICGCIRPLTKHHIFKGHVWGRRSTEIVYLCRPCHDDVEKEITRKENIILRKHPEIYTETIDNFMRRFE